MAANDSSIHLLLFPFTISNDGDVRGGRERKGCKKNKSRGGKDNRVSTVTTIMEFDEETSPPISAASKKKQLSSAMKRTIEWISSQEIPTDITVRVDGATFSLHKFPLVSKCGYMRKLLSESNAPNKSFTEIPDIPGGAKAFDLAAKFCYGTDVEISINNVAMLRCAAEYLEMTEEYAVGNLVSKTEAYLEEVVLMSLSAAVTVLHNSEDLLPIAENVKLVSRCIGAVAYIAWNDGQYGSSLSSSSSSQSKAIVDWWAEELTVLRIHTFQKVLMALKARGFRQHALGPVLMLYAQKTLRGLDMFQRRGEKIEPKEEHEKRVVLETVVSLLPRERNAVSISFLSVLLRAALYLDTTVACKLDLEERMGLQLEQAVLDDILIPSSSFENDTILDIDTVKAILVNYLEQEIGGSLIVFNSDDDYVSPPPRDLERVGRLMESYLAEIATDTNLTISRFTSVAKMIPEQARVTEDGMYRAIDIFLKAHPSIGDMERKKICSLMDCKKLSREACAHAAQNERLPVEIVVQILFDEQRRLQEAINESFVGGDPPPLSPKPTSYNIRHSEGRNEFSHLQRENENLKLQMVKMKDQLKEMEKPSGSVDKPPMPKKSLVSSVSKKLGRLYPFTRSDVTKPSSGKARTKPPKDRRHSVS